MKRRNALQHVFRGCGDVPGYGAHPGTSVLFLVTAMGGAAGFQHGAVHAAFGAGLMLAVFGPMYLWGAYDRSRSAERRDRRLATTTS